MVAMTDIQSKKLITTSWVFMSILATSPVCLIFLYLGMPGSARAGWLLAGMTTIAVKIRWDLHNRVWFWPTIVLISFVHCYAVISIPWTLRWVPAALIFPFCVADGVAILGSSDAIEALATERMNGSCPEQAASMCGSGSEEEWCCARAGCCVTRRRRVWTGSAIREAGDWSRALDSIDD